jgi:Raf kinase inhibitor-like YbhB/YbcL family protein
MIKIKKIVVLISLLILLCSCQNSGSKEEQDRNKVNIRKGEKTMELEVKSSIFNEGGMIPEKYTCDGSNVSPPLSWSGVPEGTQSLALISDDPDAPVGIWVHWVIFNIPPDVKELGENIPPDKFLPNGSRQGNNDFKKIGYGGPCPPRGTHRYYFKLYALDKKLDLDAGATKKELLQAMEGHILDESQLMGKYSR